LSNQFIFFAITLTFLYSSVIVELDVSQLDPQISELSSENVLKKVTSRFPLNFDESCKFVYCIPIHGDDI